MTLPRRPHAVVFDMDGVLFDTERLYRIALLAVSDEAGHAMPDAIFHRMIGSPWASNRDMLMDHFGADYPADTIRDAAHARLRDLTREEPFLKPGVTELLGALDDWGLPFAIATSSHHDAVQDNLVAHMLADRFPIVVAHGDYARGKPEPDPFLTAARRLGVAPELCVALEDSHHGVRSASSAGMMTIMVPDLLSPTDEIRALCATIAPDLHAVQAMIADALADG